MNKTLTKYISTPLTLTPREAALGCMAFGCAAAACLMTGLVAGMLISPRKNVTIGSHNGNVEDYRTAMEPQETAAGEVQEDEECVRF